MSKPPRPSARITLANRSLSAAEAGLVSLRVMLSRGSHDVAELTLWPRSKFTSAAPGDTLAIKLGEQDDELDVWSGEVSTVEPSASGLTITGHAPTVALSRARKSQTYLDQSVANIVRDLVESVSVDAVDGDAQLAYYAVDHRRTVWGHLLDLADLSGSEITTSPGGGLRFVSAAPRPSTTRFRFGAELLAWHVATGVEATAPSFAAHGSASESGADHWHWPNPDPTSGAGERQVIGAFGSRSLADALTTAVAERVGRARVAGQVELVGQAALRAGDAFSLSELEHGDPGSLKACTVTHRLDARFGFRTLVRVEGATA